ncbi:MAG: hypothetical protein ACYTXA_02510 [Nostoc sp.]
MLPTLTYLSHVTDDFCKRSTISGGMRGMLLLLSPDDYLRAVSGTLGAIVQN